LQIRNALFCRRLSTSVIGLYFKQEYLKRGRKKKIIFRQIKWGEIEETNNARKEVKEI
jgi:hypothetical protein